MKHMKITALLLCAALLGGCGADSAPADGETSQASESAAESETAEESYELPELKIGTEMTIGIEPMTAKAGQKNVPVPVKIWNNSGYASAGIQVFYDPALKAVGTGEKSDLTGVPVAKIETGESAEGFLTSCLIGEEKYLIAFGCMGTTANDKDGVIFTCYLDIPDDAQSGTKYDIHCVLDSVNDANSQKLKCESVDGVILIE